MQWASFDYELIKPNLNELDNNHLDNIVVFLNPKKKTNNKPIWSKIWRKKIVSQTTKV